jgi:phage FluMu protein Com
MRCGDCNKFVSYEEPEVEEDSCDVSGSEVEASVIVTLPCAECGTSLKQYTFELNEGIEHECTPELYASHSKGLDDSEIIGWDDEAEYEVENSDSWESTDRYENKTPKGKIITNPRYMKHYYGVTGTVTVKCLKCGEIIAVELSDEAQASEFEEC